MIGALNGIAADRSLTGSMRTLAGTSPRAKVLGLMDNTRIPEARPPGFGGAMRFGFDILEFPTVGLK